MENDLFLAVAQDTMNESRSPGTKKIYESIQTKYKEFLTRYYPDQIDDDGEIKLPLDVTACEAFMGKFCQNPNGTWKSYSTVNCCRSALNNLYVNSNKDIEMSPLLRKKLSTFASGYKRRMANLNQNGLIDMAKGKLPLPIQGYRLLCRLSLTAVDNNGRASNPHVLTYAHLFLVLQWNIMARTAAVANCHYSHITWRDDCLIIDLPRHKGDPEGSRSYPKHIYANPLDLVLCPVLALGVQIVSTAYSINSAVFDSDCIDNKYCKWLTRTLKNLTETQLMDLGVPMEDVGTPSVRKGIATFLSNLIGGADAISTYIRMGWSLGNDQQRHLFEGDGSDQVLGRKACGLDINDASFMTLPPHFDTTDGITDEMWNVLVPGFALYPACFKVAIPYLIALVVNASEWLQVNLPKNHPYFYSGFYRNGYGTSLKPRILLGVNSCPVTGLKATGVPPNLVLAARIKQMEDELVALRSQYAQNHVQLQEALSHAVVNEIQQRMHIEGMQEGITIDDINRSLDARLGMLQATLPSSLGTAAGAAGAAAAVVADGLQENSMATALPTYQWGGRVHIVPEGFVMPSTTTKDLFDMWLMGSRATGVGPLYLIEPKFDFAPSDSLSPRNYSKAKGVMEELMKIAVNKELIHVQSDIQHKTSTERSAIFDTCYRTLMGLDEHALTSRYRVGSITYRTVYEERVLKLRRNLIGM